MRNRVIATLVTAIVLFGGTHFLRAVTATDDTVPVPGAAAQVLDATVPAGAITEVDRLIRLFEARIADHDDPLDLRTLGKHYLERGYLTGDATAYSRATEVLTEAVEQAPNHADSRVDLAIAFLGTHQFPEALAAVSAALEIDPGHLRGRLVEGDALLASGNYDGAGREFAAVRVIVGDDPGVLVREAELAWHTGDTASASALSGLAADIALERGLDQRARAFYLTQYGRHLIDEGRYQEAVENLTLARDTDPAWALAHAELGRALAAVGDVSGAVAEFEQAVALFPNIDWLALLGDLQVIAGDKRGAQTSYDTIEVVAAVNGGNTINARQLAKFYSDHDVNLEEAVDLAASELLRRRDVYAYDTYAWALYKTGRVAEAVKAIESSLALGTKDPLILFHAGMVAMAAGDDGLARDRLREALAASPAFHPVHATTAKAVLEELGG